MRDGSSSAVTAPQATCVAVAEQPALPAVPAYALSSGYTFTLTAEA